MTKFYTRFSEKVKLAGGNDLPWFLTKLSYSFFWVFMMFMMIGDCKDVCPYPTGICELYTFRILFTPVGKIFLSALLIMEIILYLLEIKMVSTLFVLFFISCIVMSFHESNGLFARATVYSVIWFAQLLAYFIKYLKADFALAYWRVQYSVQAIAAAYTLAGLAKLSASGLGWVNAGQLFSIQVMKNYAFLYSDTGSFSFIEHALAISGQLVKHKILLTIMLSVSLALETFCMAAALNKSIRIVFGIGLLLMHIGIAVILGIGISAIAFPMCIFFIIPFNKLATLLRKRPYNIAGT
jgi:hypothetical protein